MSLDKPQLLITGASGFVGRRLCERTSIEGWPVRRAVRCPGGHHEVVVGDLGADTDWSAALSGIDCVVHLAARVHVMNETISDPLAAYRRINVEGTLNIARQAAVVNVKRFIFISSIKVNGASTLPGKLFAADDQPNPVDPYGISKWETEVGLQQLAKETGMEVVIIRPPLVYGPGVKANFQNMMRWIDRGVPLPLGAIHNKRSFVSIDNLVDLIITCIEHPGAANQTFLAADGEDLSTTELLRRVARALGKSARLIPIPVSILTLIASLLGKKDLAQRLCGSLQVDISKAQVLLGWQPPVSLDECLRQVAEEYKK